jgi:hypothetical protein
LGNSVKFGIRGLLIATFLVSDAALASEFSVTEQSVFSLYKSLELLTPAPIPVSPDIAIRCTTPSAAALAADERRAGPHSNAYVNLYVNAIAKQAIADEAARFPVGAVIVKEKLQNGTAVAVIGGMVKRPQGFDPANGDWEYFYAALTGGFASGRLESCISCHSQPAARDHVFLSRLHSPTAAVGR